MRRKRGRRERRVERDAEERATGNGSREPGPDGATATSTRDTTIPLPVRRGICFRCLKVGRGGGGVERVQQGIEYLYKFIMLDHLHVVFHQGMQNSHCHFTTRSAVSIQKPLNNIELTFES